MRYNHSMDIAGFLAAAWSEPGDALIEPPRLSPVVADPSFLFPEETPSGNWELFAHSAWGIHRYASIDGISWADQGIVVWHAMRPFARRFDGTYFLYYEKYRPFALPMTALPRRPRWQSTVSMSTSADLSRWSRPATLITPSLDWMGDPALGDAVSNPCVMEAGTGRKPGDAPEWRLYFSASLAWIDDCGFSEPRYIAVARGPSPTGPFVPEHSPVIVPAGDGPADDVPAGDVPAGENTSYGSSPGELGAGSIKVIRMDDGWIGLQNKIYRDPGGRSRSAIFVLRSEDGLSWRPAAKEPLIAPGAGWTSSHVYACDCRYREADGNWYLYFNARDGWTITEGKERIGRIVGTPQP
jgi:hypothetical protein